MAVIKFNQEIKVKVSAKRMFKALVTDSHVVIPKLVPNVVKSIELHHGDGGAGSIRQTNFADGSPHSYIKHNIEDVDSANYSSKYSLIEGPALGGKIEKIHYEQKFEEASDGGCLIKSVVEYHTKGDAQLSDEEIKKGNDEFVGYMKLTEESLLAHPDICA